MFVAKVTGSLVATQKVEAMNGHKLLVVEPYRVEPTERKRAGDDRPHVRGRRYLGAGDGEFVLLTQGSSARLTPETKNLPIDAVIIGIVDHGARRRQRVFQHAIEANELHAARILNPNTEPSMQLNEDLIRASSTQVLASSLAPAAHAVATAKSHAAATAFSLT